jgi:hypothetical protein
MDTSARNSAYRFNTRVRCDCGCKKMVPLRTRNRHREKQAKARAEARTGDTSGTENDVEMLEDSNISDSAPQNAPELHASEVANDSVPPEPAALLDENPRDMELDDNDDPGSMMLQDRTKDRDVEEELSEAPSSPGSWYHIGTPPPSPPRSPLVRSDEEKLEDEDGYFNITEDDYREYDRWYADDCEAELDELRKCY